MFYYPLAMILLSFLLYLPVVFGVGFLSDDYDLLLRVQHVHFWQATETHHYSMLTNLLFMTGSPVFIHVVTLCVHTMNAILLFVLSERYLSFSKHAAACIALLFLVSPAGYEAIAWCCAAGFVMTGFWLLCTLLVYYSGRGNGWVYTFLQIAALLTWDWGTVIAPSLVLLTALSTYPRKKEFWHKATVLIAPMCVWVGYVLMKKWMGWDLGYHINTPMDWLKILGATPLLTYFPEGAKSFYSAWPGMGAALLIWAAIFFLARKYRLVREMLAVSLVCLGPVMLMGHPQSRYYYLQTIPFLLIGAQGMISVVKSSSIRLALGAGALLAGLIWNQDRLVLWLQASEQAQRLGQEIVAASHEGPVIVSQMPEKWGPEDKIWLPWLWQCGTAIFGPSVSFCPSDASLANYHVVQEGGVLRLVHVK